MTYREPARRTTRRIPTIPVVGLLVVVAAITVSLGYPMLSTASSSPPASASPPASSSWSSATRIPVLRGWPPGALGEAEGVVPSGAMVLRPGQRGALGGADGVLPDGTTVFDDEIPGIANLDPDLLGARRRVRAVPDLPQRTLALRTAPRSHQSRLPSYGRRPHARSKDAMRGRYTNPTPGDGQFARAPIGIRMFWH